MFQKYWSLLSLKFWRYVFVQIFLHVTFVSSHSFFLILLLSYLSFLEISLFHMESSE